MIDVRVNSRGEFYKDSDFRSMAFRYLGSRHDLSKRSRVLVARELKELEYIWNHDIEAFLRLIDE